MRKLFFAAAAAAALGSGAMIGGVAAMAAPGTAQGVSTAIQNLDVVQDAAFIFGGRRHCWYARGWHGAGWYWCGYATRKGRGWGGEDGWNGWHHR